MTAAEKLDMIKSILRIDDSEQDTLLSSYLDMAGREVLAWRYSDATDAPQDVPAEFEMVQVQAVINGYTQAGVEGQNSSSENGIHRRFENATMTDYIHKNVIPIAKVM